MISKTATVFKKFKIINDEAVTREQPFNNFTKVIKTSTQITTPYMLIDPAVIERQYKALAGQLPLFKIFYAAKCNPSPGIIQKLKQLGSSFEAASLAEVRLLLDNGVDKENIIFSNPVKIHEHIESAFKLGIKHFAFDSQSEVDKLAKLAPGSLLHLRLSVSNVGSAVKLSSKFGATVSQATELMVDAKKKGLKPYGITFHVGSQALNEDAWKNALKQTAAVLTGLRKEQIKPKVINIGGGFPVQYAGKVPHLNVLTTSIKQSIHKYGLDKYEFWCEPGRFLAADSTVIVASIIGKSIRNGREWLYLDVGKFQAFIEMFESEDFQYPVISLKEGLTTEYVLTGPTCDAFDTMFLHAQLPANLEIGDKVIFAKAGAYTTVYGSAFNGFDIPQPYYVDVEAQEI